MRIFLILTISREKYGCFYEKKNKFTNSFAVND